jgi:signal transduction histidine kinase
MTVHRRLLLIDSDAGDRELLRVVLSAGSAPFETVAVEDAVGFARHLLAGDFDAVVCEASLDWAAGLELLDLIAERWPERPRFLFARALPESVATLALERGLAGYLAKTPAGFAQLPRLLAAAFARGGGGAREGAAAQVAAVVPAALLGLDREGIVVEANGAAQTLLGGAGAYSVAGRALPDLLPGLAEDAGWQALLGGRAERLDRMLEPPPGTAAGGALRLQVARGPEAVDAGAVRFGAVAVTAPADGGEDGDMRVELERTTEELEQLAYAVSHDLQEPLQLVLRNAELLSARHGDELDAEAGRFVEHLMESATRLQGMIDGVLAYSRLGGSPASPGPVDLDDVVTEVLRNLAPNLEEAEAQVHRGPLPTVVSDRQKLVQLFQNLVSNALKFRGDESLKLTITARDDGGHWRFMVKDNGIGIEPRFHDRVFGMFQRLHTAEEYPGTGIGLALCKRIVQQQGGRIWVKSRPGEGAAFYFTLPK